MEIKGFLETSFLDWPGQIVSVLFLPGCNFRCPYCHNYKLVLQPEDYETFPFENVVKHLSLSKPWIDGICVSGGEPTIHIDLFAFMEKFKNLDLLLKLDTNGTNPEVLERLIDAGLVDYIAMDIKAPLNEIQYSNCTGIKINKKTLNGIEESIRLLKKNVIPHQFRTTVVPSLLNKEDIMRIAKCLDTPNYVLQNFNPQDPLNPKFKEEIPYTEEEFKELQALIK